MLEEYGPLALKLSSTFDDPDARTGRGIAPDGV